MYCFTVPKYHNFFLACGILSANSQMELRTMAGAAKCDPMIEAFRNGADIHLMNASKIFRKPPEEVKPEERRYAKMSCTLGSTMIKLVSGGTKSIKELYDSGKSDFYIYSYDIDTRKVVPGKVVHIELTKFIDKAIKITFDNGKSIEVTHNHRLLDISGIYKFASELVAGDRIESLFYRVPTKGAFSGGKYEQIRDVHHSYKCSDKTGELRHTRYGKWRYTHQEFFESYHPGLRKEGYQIDHIDHNTVNNSPENLQLLTTGENRSKTWSKSTKDKLGILAQASKIVTRMLEEKVGLTGNNFDQVMLHMYEGRGHLYWSTVSRYYSFEDICRSIMTRRGYTSITLEMTKNPVKGMKLNDVACRKVIKVEEVYYNEPTPVYDLSVEGYHNYAIDLGDNSGIFSHNSFMILYGGDYHTFGNQFLGGDIALAKSIYDSFYSAYPEVADYIKAKHDEAKEHEKVTTLMEMFISLEANDPQFHGDENARMRLAQNAPIQSASSMLAGCCLYEIMKYIQNNNMKSKVILFVHDSIEVDIHPDEMLELGTKIIPLMNQFPNEKFNLPVKADLVLGKSIGQEVEIQSIECNDDYTEGWLECESTEEHFDSLIDTWKSVYPVVEYEDIDEPKVKYKSWSDLWIPKLAIQKGYGEDYRIVHRKVHIKTKT